MRGPLQRLITQEGVDLDVYQPTETATAGEGYDVSYPDPASASPDATVRGIIEDPSVSPDRDEGGTTRDVDWAIGVRDDTGATFTDFGETGDAATLLVDSDGREYLVRSTDPGAEGLLWLNCAERS